MSSDSAPWTPNALQCAVAVQAVITRFVTTQLSAISAAGELFCQAIRQGGVIQAFGTGHSEALVMEFVGRAGGLVPTTALSLADLVLFGGEDPWEAFHPTAERDQSRAERILDLAPIHPSDVFVIASNSGVNGVVVEMASLVKGRGHALVAITSLAHSTATESRHPSGAHLYDLADVTIDNGAPLGDALLVLPEGDAAVGAVSSVTNALAAEMIVADTVGRLLAFDQEPAIYRSANIPGSDRRNQELEERYAGRIRRWGLRLSENTTASE